MAVNLQNNCEYDEVINLYNEILISKYIEEFADKIINDKEILDELSEKVKKF